LEKVFGLWEIFLGPLQTFSKFAKRVFPDAVFTAIHVMMDIVFTAIYIVIDIVQ
jgi:hypothetical protein